MLWIAFATLRDRKGGALGALAAVVLAVTLVVSCGILLDSSLRSHVPVERLAGAGVVVQASPSISGGGEVDVWLRERPTLPARLATTLAGIDGVRAAVADRSFDLQLAGRPDAGRVVGHGWSSAALTPYALVRGRSPRTATEVVIAGALAGRLGDRIVVVTPGAERTVTVVGVAAGHGGERALFFSDRAAAALSGRGSRADLIGLVLARGADPARAAGRARSLLGPGVRVLTGAGRGDAESPEDAVSREDVVAGLTIFGLIGAFVAAFVVASTFALSVQLRQRELALLRAVGSTPRQVRRMIAGEALLIALAAAVLAVPAGVVAAHLERGLFTRAGALQTGLELRVGWLPLAAGVLAAVVTAQVAAVASARRASRIRPTEALRESGVPRRLLSWPRAVLGLAAVAGGVAVLLLSGGGRDGSAPAAAFVWMLAVALLGPLLAWPFTFLVRLGGGAAELARANTRANLQRVASAATPVVLALALVCTFVYGKTILQQQTARQTAERTTATHVLEAAGAAGLPPGTAARARRVPGVTAASASFATSVVIAAGGSSLRLFEARAIDAATLPAVVDLGVASGSITAVTGDAVAISTTLAAQVGRHAGERIALRLGDGTRATPWIAATYRRGLGFGDVLLPAERVRAHVSHPFDDTVLVATRAGSATRVGDRLRQLGPRVQVLTRTGYEREVGAAAESQALGIYLILALVVVFCALALVNATALSTSERSRELALLRLIGAERRQVRAMLRAETLVVLAFGVIAGSLVAAPGSLS